MLEFTIWSFFYEFRKRSIDKNNKDNTPLHYAVERDKKEIVEKLLQEWKADVNAKNNKGDTPLHIAVSRNNKKLVSLLLDKQARGDIKNNEGKAPYELAKNQEVSYIFKHRSSHSSDYDDIMSQANLNEELIKIVKSSTSEKQKSNDIEDLLKKGANINFQDANYELNTPLHAAVRKQEPKVVKLLVKNGAIQIKNSKGKMPLDIAKSLNNEGIIRELGRASLLKRENTGDNKPEIGSSKKPRISFMKKEEPEGTKIEEDESRTYLASGLNNTLHGNIYQLKLLMLFLKRGLDKSYSFRLATE